MIIRNVLQETNGVFKKNLPMLIGFCFAFFAIIFASLLCITLLDENYTFLVLLGIFLLIPSTFTSIDFIARKCVNNQELDYKDFYIGNKNFMTSMTVQTKVISRGLWFALLGYFAVVLVGMFILGSMIMETNPEVVDAFFAFANGTSNKTLEEILVMSNNVTYLETFLSIVDIVSLIVAGVVYVFTGKRYSFLPFITFETAFSFNSLITLAQDCSDRIKKKFRTYNFIYFGIALIIFAGSLGLQTLLQASLGEQISLIVAIAVGCLIATPIFFYYKISLYVIYASHFKNEIDAKFKEKLESLKNQQH